MTGRIPEHLIEQIREQTDIVELVGEYVQLKHSGDNHLGLCPFHQEKTPSFNVNGSRQIFHCFGCDAGGNVFSFLMRMEGLSFPEAVRRLAARAGIAIETDQPSPRQRQEQLLRQRRRDLLELAARHYRQQLADPVQGAAARDYLARRGFKPPVIERFGLGYAGPAWDGLVRALTAAGADLTLARELGLIRPGREGRGDYDLFRARLLFPIGDLAGQPLAFGGRRLDNELPKYINSPESPLYRKSQTLYGLYQAKAAMRRERRVVVVEGYFDVLALSQAGIEAVVATCGTALTEEHARLLRRYVDRVLLLFDQDAAGQKAGLRALPQLLATGLQVQSLSLPAGDDPDSCVQREGAAAFEQRLAQAQSALDAEMERQLSAASSAEARSRAIEGLLTLIRAVPGAIERALHLQALAQRSGLTPELLQQQLEAPAAAAVTPARTERPADSSGPSALPPPPDEEPPWLAAAPLPPEPPEDLPPLAAPPAPAPAAPPDKIQLWLLRLLLQEKNLAGAVLQEGIDRLFAAPAARQLAAALIQAGQQGEDARPLLEQLGSGEALRPWCRQLLADGAPLHEDVEKSFADCRQAVRQGQLKQRRSALHAQMREAEARGDSAQQMACLQELTEINRQLKNRNGMSE
ncbi:MAG: DNA primase [Desulfuromonas thiophila]|nr:DNA primase [Desulfuromonas thiophila]